MGESKSSAHFQGSAKLLTALIALAVGDDSSCILCTTPYTKVL